MESSTVSPEQLVAARLGRPGEHAVPARHEEGDLGERHVAVGQVHAGQVALQVVDAHDRHTPARARGPWPLRCRPAARPPGPGRTSRRRRRGPCPATPASSRARSTIGVIVSTWARLASSGTTPPNVGVQVDLARHHRRAHRRGVVDDGGGRLVARRLDRQQRPRHGASASARSISAREIAPSRSTAGSGPRTLTSVEGTSSSGPPSTIRSTAGAEAAPPRRVPCAASARRAGWRW